jgi:hypothetical protein
MENQTKKANVKLSHLFHNQTKQIRLDFNYDPVLVEDVKEIKGMKWSKANKCWYIFNNKENLKAIFDTLKGKVQIDGNDFFKQKKEAQVNQLTIQEIIQEPNYYEIIDQYLEALQERSYSKSTLKSHKNSITNFVDFLLNRKGELSQKA